MGRSAAVVIVIAAALIVWLARESPSPRAGALPPPVEPLRSGPAAHAHPDDHALLEGVTKLDPAELRRLLESSGAVVIDVRDADSYLAGHIPRALHIPVAYIEGEIPYLSKDLPVVTYCT